jgi:hypothetical protein
MESKDAGLPVNPSANPDGSQGTGSRDWLAIAQRVYPPDSGGGLSDKSDYTPILEAFGLFVVRQDEDGYTGDSWVLYADAGRGFGFLQFGWGSCSGCDALQDCGSYEQLAKLMAELFESIRWLKRPEMLKLLQEHDWAGDYSSCDEQRRFVQEAIAYLESASENVPAIQSPTPQQEPKKGTQGGK